MASRFACRFLSCFEIVSGGGTDGCNAVAPFAVGGGGRCDGAAAVKGRGGVAAILGGVCAGDAVAVVLVVVFTAIFSNKAYPLHCAPRLPKEN